MLYQTIIAEKSKSRKTFAFWMILIGAILVPVICLLVEFFRWRYFVPQEGENAWNKFVILNMSFSAGLLFPFLVILMVALNVNLEYKADSWKKMYVVPVRKETIFWGKLLYLAWQLLLCTVILFSVIILTGLLLGWLRPELGFLDQPLDVLWLLKLLLSFFVSFLGILAIQLFLSLVFSNIIVPITAGIMCVIVTLVIVNGWKYAMFEPYAFPILLAYNIDSRIEIPLWLGFRMTQVLSVVYFVVASLCGMFYYKTKKIK